MKKILSRISIIALVLAMTMSIAIPAFAAEGSNGEHICPIEANGYDEDAYKQLFKSRFNPGWKEAVGFRTGGFGDAESTGVLGVPEGYGLPYGPSCDCVKWTLKDGILHIYGDGSARYKDASGWESNPFANNPHIKTVIISGNVRGGITLVNDAPNVETIILVDTPTAGGVGSMWNKLTANIIVYGDTVYSGAFDNGNTVYHVVNNLTVDESIMVFAISNTTYSYVPNDITVSTVDNWHHTDSEGKYVPTVVQPIVNGVPVPTRYDSQGRIQSTTYKWAISDNGREALRYSRDELAAMSANIIADIDLPDWALALIPGELGGTAPAAQTPAQPAVQFTDVPADAYYAAPVQWAVDKGITSGTSSTTFSPDATCTNAHILTFLYRAAGSPQVEAQGGVANVTADDYYYNSASWANSLGMINAAAFDPGAPCTRASTVVYMWQAAGSPTVDATTKFTDVPADADYAMAVAWALENGVTSGTSSTTFSPDATCTRGQIVTFLHRAFAK